MAEPKLETDVKKIDPDAARQVVEAEDAASVNGVAPGEVTDSGIVLSADKNDKSVRTYDPNDVKRAEETQVKPSKNSGEPVHDRH